MELLHCEKLRKQKIELEKAEMDLVSVSDVNCAEGACHWECASLFHIFQGEYEFSPEILSGKLAEVVYKDAAGKIQGREFKLLLALGHYRYLNFLSWLDEMRILFYELYCLTDCIIDTFSSTKCSFFSSVQQKQSLWSHFCTLPPSLISPKISRSSFCKSEQLVSSFFCLIFAPLQNLPRLSCSCSSFIVSQLAG